MSNSRPCIAISACLLGEAVRYDGGHKRDSWLVEVLGAHVDWLPICPEMQMGLGTPRKTLHISGGDSPRLIQTETGKDLTESADRAATEILKKIEEAHCVALILKSRSPSCGLSVESIPEQRLLPGVFASVARESVPLAVEDVGLQSFETRHRFLEAVFTLHRFRSLQERISEIQVFHARHKLLLMARSPSATKKLGGIAADSGASFESVRVRYERELMDVLRASPEKVNAGLLRNALEHGVGYLRERVPPKDLESLRQDVQALSVKEELDRDFLWSIQDRFAKYAASSDVDYLAAQFLFCPYPEELRKPG